MASPFKFYFFRNFYHQFSNSQKINRKFGGPANRIFFFNSRETEFWGPLKNSQKIDFANPNTDLEKILGPNLGPKNNGYTTIEGLEMVPTFCGCFSLAAAGEYIQL